MPFEPLPKAFIFDLDGTLTPTRELMGEENANIICELLKKGSTIVVISGSVLSQFIDRFINRLSCIKEFPHKIYLLPTNGAQMYLWDGKKPIQLYKEVLSRGDKKKITRELAALVERYPNWFPKETYGPRIDDRETQISIAGLGLDAPRPLKEKWDPDHAKRDILAHELIPKLEEFTVVIGGTTTIDVTKKGIDKAFGIFKFLDHANLTPKDAIFIGDGIFPGGDDYGVLRSGVKGIAVNNHTEIKHKLAAYLN